MAWRVYVHEVDTARPCRWSNPNKTEVCGWEMAHMGRNHAAHELVSKLVVRHNSWEKDTEEENSNTC